MTRTSNGFTLVEMILVITVVGILVGISIVGYLKVQVDARDSERASKITLIADALEKYHAKNGEYPGCSAMTQTGATTSATLDVDADVLLAPSSAVGVTNSITCTALVVGGTDAYAYVGDGTATCNTGAACTTYTLQYFREGAGSVISKAGKYAP